MAALDGIEVNARTGHKRKGAQVTEQTADTIGTETTSKTDSQTADTETTEKSKEFQAITSQEDFDAAIKARLARERKQFEGHEDFKAKAEKFDALEEAQKTEAQKSADKIAELEKENGGLKLAQLRSEVATAKSDASKGIFLNPSLLSGSTKEELEASADALIEFKGSKAPVGVHLPNQDKTPQGSKSDLGETARKLFGGQ